MATNGGEGLLLLMNLAWSWKGLQRLARSRGAAVGAYCDSSADAAAAPPRRRKTKAR